MPPASPGSGRLDEQVRVHLTRNGHEEVDGDGVVVGYVVGVHHDGLVGGTLGREGGGGRATPLLRARVEAREGEGKPGGEPWPHALFRQVKVLHTK